MKNKIIIFSFLLSTGLLCSCSGDHNSRPGEDTSRTWQATNPYRDTFATTNSMGEAINTENSGSGGTKIAKPHPQQTDLADTTTKK